MFLLSSPAHAVSSTILRLDMPEATPSLISNVPQGMYTRFMVPRISIPIRRTKISLPHRLNSVPAPFRRTSLYIGIHRSTGSPRMATVPKLSPELTTSRVLHTTAGTTVSLMIMQLQRPRHSHPTSATSPLAVTLEQTMVGKTKRICLLNAATSSMAKRIVSHGTDWNFQRRLVTSWGSLSVSYK